MVRSIEARLFWELDEQLLEPILDLDYGDGTFAEIALPTRHGHFVGIDPRVDHVREAHARALHFLQVLQAGTPSPRRGEGEQNGG